MRAYKLVGDSVCVPVVRRLVGQKKSDVMKLK